MSLSKKIEDFLYNDIYFDVKKILDNKIKN